MSDGVGLAARFSLPTSRRGFCGPDGAPPILYRAAVGEDTGGAARAALERFEALAPYLRAIGERHGLDPLDARVVEAYWIGNELLEAFDAGSFRAILAALRSRGLPPSVERRLAAALPEGAVPHHLFHVAFVGVGAVTGHVPTTLPNMESCRPAAAVVRSVTADGIEVEGSALTVRDGRLVLTGTHRRALPRDAGLLPTVAPGAPVVVHWGTPVATLSDAQRRALDDYSARSLEAANRALPSLGLDLRP